MKQKETILSIRHLKKSFGDAVILNDLNLDINKGEVVVIVGPSGCGKSTLLRCINGLEGTDEGEILLHQEAISLTGKNMSSIRQKIGMVFQSYDLFPHLTILENIILAPVKVQKREIQCGGFGWQDINCLQRNDC